MIGERETVDDWLKELAFHPADTKLKQLGHELARRAVASLMQLLYWLLPPGRNKSLARTHLELVVMYANKALAVGGGPDPLMYDEEVLKAALKTYAGVQLPSDPRIEEYQAEQRGEAPTLPGADPAASTTLGVTGGLRQEAAEGAVYGEAETEAPETFRAEFEDGDCSIKVIGGRQHVAVAVVGPEGLPIDPDEDGKFGWYVNLTTPTAVNQFLSAVAAAGDRAFTS
jgi:hypothetical protein